MSKLGHIQNKADGDELRIWGQWKQGGKDWDWHVDVSISSHQIRKALNKKVLSLL